MWVVVQEGGTTGELYATAYGKREDATAAICSHQQATYLAYGPFALPADPRETDWLELVEVVGAAIAKGDYA